MTIHLDIEQSIPLGKDRGLILSLSKPLVSHNHLLFLNWSVALRIVSHLVLINLRLIMGELKLQDINYIEIKEIVQVDQDPFKFRSLGTMASHLSIQ